MPWNVRAAEPPYVPLPSEHLAGDGKMICASGEAEEYLFGGLSSVSSSSFGVYHPSWEMSTGGPLGISSGQYSSSQSA